MGKIHKLKKWLSLEQSAAYLSEALAEKIVVADLLQLAIDGHLVMSINFITGYQANFGDLKDQSEVDDSIKYATRISKDKYIVWDSYVEDIEGVFDIPDIFDSMAVVKERLHLEMDGTKFIDDREGRAYVRDIGGTKYARLVEYDGDDDDDEEDQAVESLVLADGFDVLINEHGFIGNYHPCRTSLDGVTLVVRTESLTEFLSNLEEPSNEKPISSRERNNLLKVIAALCHVADLKNKKGRGEPKWLETVCDRMGLGGPSDDTIRGILDQAARLPRSLSNNNT